MKTKISSIILFVFFALATLSSVETMKGKSLKDILTIQKVSADVDKHYYDYTYGCTCQYTPPPECPGQPVSATCTNITGTACTTGFVCRYVFWYNCQGMSQHSCDAPQ